MYKSGMGLPIHPYPRYEAMKPGTVGDHPLVCNDGVLGSGFTAFHSFYSSNHLDPKTSIWTLDSKKYSKCWKKGRSKHCELKYARLDGSRALNGYRVYIYICIYVQVHI